MTKQILATYILIFFLLLGFMHFSPHTHEKIRGKSLQYISPLVEKVLSIKHSVLHPLTPSPFQQLSDKEYIEQLLLENHLYQLELSALKQELNEEQCMRYTSVVRLETDNNQEQTEDSHLSKVLPARVFFRPLDAWNDTLWINVGSETNKKLKQNFVSINSIVVKGLALVGIIDFVGEKQSRVRLISDTRLNPSVRVARGREEDLVFVNYVDRVIKGIMTRNMISPHEKSSFIEQLNTLKKQIQPSQENLFLAKGELRGSAYHPSPREGIVLKGTGFNFEGAIPIIKTGDILVTTGMDGIFPPGLQVASISQVKPLKEGDYFFDIEAQPIVADLETLSLVFVLPPIQPR